jgi:hypothetical protein
MGYVAFHDLAVTSHLSSAPALQLNCAASTGGKFLFLQDTELIPLPGPSHLLWFLLSRKLVLAPLFEAHRSQ